ncbi:MAG: bacillithiol biosynthesis cysteine-adding enzyme BshC [Blastocatellia bacterium]|nr:bacillithiol biosynthesis cysteine-adding enzyme BshC [Blastocatellia bacterium]
MNNEQASVEPANISFDKIPKTSRLFLEYIYKNDQVAKFYNGSTFSNFKDIAQEVIKQEFDRETVAEVLKAQNVKYGSSELTFRNIELLRNPSTVAVVTGQQAGLFSGPLFTIYKALTAIKLAKTLSEEGTTAVAIFWVASDDHDFAEVDHCKIINNEGKLQTIRYQQQEAATTPSVGQIKLSDSIKEQISELISALPASEFIAEISEMLHESYQPGNGFAESFAKLLAKLFAPYGVILLNPQDEKLKQLAAKLIAPVIRESHSIAEALVAHTKQLEMSGYHAQVHINQNTVPVFVTDDGSRTAIIREGNCFILKTSSKCRSMQDLLNQLQANPSNFSPSVLLRPIVQDFLLPTVAYIGGPAEIAYFAQLLPLYQFFNRIPPRATPRKSLTIVQKRFYDLMNKYELTFQDLFYGRDGILKKVIEQSVDSETTAIFEQTEKLFDSQLDSLRQSLLKVDPTLAEALKNGKEKIFYQLQNLRTRFVTSSAKRQETLARQLERMLLTLMPEGNLQERELNLFFFFARYGRGFIDTLYNSIDLNSPDHKLVYSLS